MVDSTCPSFLTQWVYFMARFIKKSSRGFFYDKEQDSSVTLNDLKKYVLLSEDFSVIEEKSGTDITRSVLLQIFFQEVNSRESVFSNQFLKMMIIFCSSSSEDLFHSFFEKNIQDFIHAYEHFLKQKKEGEKDDAHDHFLLSSYNPWTLSSFQENMNLYLETCQTHFEQAKNHMERVFSSEKQDSE